MEFRIFLRTSDGGEKILKDIEGLSINEIRLLRLISSGSFDIDELDKKMHDLFKIYNTDQIASSLLKKDLIVQWTEKGK